MLLRPKTKLLFDSRWVNKLIFKEHTDYDLAGNVDAIAVKSESGNVFDFYRSDPVENPEDFTLTKVYHQIKEVRELIDYFSFLQTSRVRIHKQIPGNIVPLHTDGNNVNAKVKTDYNLRMVTALTADEDFVYRFKEKGELREFSLKQGESVIFDPDLVEHGMDNNSKTETRYALVQIFKAYPVHRGLIDFINTNQLFEI